MQRHDNQDDWDERYNAFVTLRLRALENHLVTEGKLTKTQAQAVVKHTIDASPKSPPLHGAPAEALSGFIRDTQTFAAELRESMRAETPSMNPKQYMAWHVLIYSRLFSEADKKGVPHNDLPGSPITAYFENMAAKAKFEPTPPKHAERQVLGFNARFATPLISG